MHRSGCNKQVGVRGWMAEETESIVGNVRQAEKGKRARMRKRRINGIGDVGVWA